MSDLAPRRRTRRPRLTATWPAALPTPAPAEAPADASGGGGLLRLLGLPVGAGLDPEVRAGAACADQPPELFFPEPGDTAAEQAAKRVCAGCPVRAACLAMAIASGDVHAILGGTTPAERRPPDPHPGPDRDPDRRRPAVRTDPVVAQAAFRLACQVGVRRAAAAYDCNHATLRRAFDQHGLGQPTRSRRGWDQPSPVAADRDLAAAALELACVEGVAAASRAYGVCDQTLRRAWRRWGLTPPAAGPGLGRGDAA